MASDPATLQKAKTDFGSNPGKNGIDASNITRRAITVPAACRISSSDAVKGRPIAQTMLAGEAVILLCFFFTHIAFLWYNVIGAVVVVGAGVVFSSLSSAPVEHAATSERDII